VQLNMYRNDGVIDHCTIIPAATNTDAILEGTAGGTAGITRYCTLVPNGTGTSYKNSGGSRSTSIVFCAMPVAVDSSITNLVSTPYNVVNSNITQ
jgi:hypothetical protein